MLLLGLKEPKKLLQMAKEGKKVITLVKESYQQCINLLRLCHYCLYIHLRIKRTVKRERGMACSYIIVHWTLLFIMILLHQ